MKKIAAKVLLVLFLTAQFYGLVFLFPEKLDSANLTSVSDTLSNNRLSFRGQLDGAVAAGSGVFSLKTSGLAAQYTSSGSASLMGNESVKVGTNAPIAIKTIETASRVVLTSGLTTAASDGDPVIATVSAVHTVSFIPVSTIPHGAFRALIPATSTYNAADGLPDKDGFDCGGSGASCNSTTVSCLGGSGIDIWEPGTATASAIQVPAGTGTWYHSFECRYSGSGGSGTAVTMYIGTSAGNKLINPSPAGTSCTGSPAHCPGQADTYVFRVRHTEGNVNSYTFVDETLGRVGVVEAVRVTAVVSPTLTFQISGRAANSTSCGQATPTDIGTTYNSVPFGTSVSVTSFADLAQQLVVSTNAVGGYAVTASESGALSKGGLGITTISNTACDSGSCLFNDSSASLWTDTTKKGFGYALENVAGSPVPTNLRYAACGAYCARPFGTTGATIMTTSAPVDSDIAYVCYRIVVSGTQAAGDYENYVIYIATATF